MVVTKYYESKYDAESHRKKKSDRIYYEAGKGWYILPNNNGLNILMDW